MFDLEKMPSQEGKIAIVTGSNIGLGYETALGLAKKGTHIVMACRNRNKACKARDEMIRKLPGARVEVMEVDLSSKSSIARFAEKFRNAYSSLDILVNNAGIMVPPYKETEDGFESQWGVNYLGHFYLTGLLLDSLMKIEGSRIVTISSIAHRNGSINWDDVNRTNDYKPMESYRQSKLACLMFAYELDRRLRKAKVSVKSIAAHPGIAVTNLLANGPKWITTLEPYVSWMLPSAKAGARSILMAAMDRTVNGGDYIGPGGFREMGGNLEKVGSNDISRNLAACERLWRLSEEQMGFRFEV